MARQRQAARSNEWKDMRQKGEEPRECPPREKKPDETTKRVSNRCLNHANGKVSFLNVRRRQCRCGGEENEGENLMREPPDARSVVAGTRSGCRSS